MIGLLLSTIYWVAMEFSKPLTEQATALLAACRAQKWRIGTAESCTGGLLASLLTEIPGSSDVFMAGLVTYSNEAKQQLLGITTETLSRYGAVSEQTATEMAQAANIKLSTDLSAAITGIAGPGGGTPEKPVGLVHIAVCLKGKVFPEACRFEGTRQQIRMAAVGKALAMMEEQLN